MNVDVGRIPFPALNDVTDRAMSNCFCRLMQPWFGEIISVFLCTEIYMGVEIVWRGSI